MPTRAYDTTLYHDEPDEGAAIWGDAGVHFTLDTAVEAIRAKLDDYWHYGSVHLGDYEPPLLGVRPEVFVSDENETPWQVGLDYCDRG